MTDSPREPFYWLNKDSRDFLRSGYLLPGVTPEQRVRQIAERAEEILRKPGFADKFYDYMSRGWYSLSSPVWSNFGMARGLPISCFSSFSPDSMHGIFDTASEVAMMSKHGGGTAVYLGALRPRGAPIQPTEANPEGENGQSEGAVHFAQLFETTMKISKQGTCYIEGTEVLTDQGFVDFRDVVKGVHKVAQVDDRNNISFTSDFDLTVSEYSGDMVSLRGKKRGDLLNLDVTGNHSLVIERLSRPNGIKTWEGRTQKVYAKDFNPHRDNRMYLAGKATGTGELTTRDRIKIAFQADGYFYNYTEYNVKFRLVKDRKIERLVELLDAEGITYKVERKDDNVTEVSAILDFEVSKDFRDMFSLEDFSYVSAVQFVEELKHWDGSTPGEGRYIAYSTVNLSNLDFAQAVGVLANKRTTVRVREAKGNRQTLYRVTFSDIPHVGGDAVVKETYKHEGTVYCAVVPEGRLVVRSGSSTLICGNTRRGSTAVYLPIEHPDIMEFLDIRTDGNPIQELQFAVTVTDDWMQAMIDGDRDKRKTWAKVLQKRSDVGSPYITFIDNVNRSKPQVYHDNSMDIYASNLCNEVMLPSSEDESFVCCLSSMNLYHYEEWEGTDAVQVLTYFLDAVMSEFIEKAKDIPHFHRAVRFAERHRALGLGVLGYHSFLQSKSIPFDTFEATVWNARIFRYLEAETNKATESLARLLGEPELLKGYGRRNTTTMALAPTTSSSFILGQVSQSIEPLRSNYFIKDLAKSKTVYQNPELKRILSEKYGRDEDAVWESILQAGGSVQHLAFMDDHDKAVFKTFAEISPMDIVQQAGQRQKWIDQGQSLNLMIHPDMPTKDVNQVYIEAWRQGVKGLYYQHSFNAAQEYTREMLECSACAA